MRGSRPEQAILSRDTDLSKTADPPGGRCSKAWWTGSILRHLKGYPVRFNDLSRMVGGASKKMIAERLRQLEARGLVRRGVRNTSPVAVEYSLTPLGQTVIEFLFLSFLHRMQKNQVGRFEKRTERTELI